MPVRTLDELSDLEKLSLVPISYSRLDTYFGASYGCKAKYFYQYILKEERTFGAAATLGNVIHDVLEEELFAGEKVTEELLNRIKIRYDELLAEVEEEISPELISNGVLMLEEFVDRHKGETFDIVHKELAFNVVLGQGLLNGFIDRIDVVGNRVNIIDYKSGKQEVAAKAVHGNLQLGIYALVAQKFFPGKEIHASLYYLKSGRIKGHLFTTDDLLLIESKLLSLIDELIHRQNYDFTPNASTCYYCDFAKNGTCPMGAKRVRR